MMGATKSRKIVSRETDKKARVTLFADFACTSVTIERMNSVEMRVRKKRGQRFSLAELLATVTPDNLHGEIRIGPSVGKESW